MTASGQRARHLTPAEHSAYSPVQELQIRGETLLVLRSTGARALSHRGRGRGRSSALDTPRAPRPQFRRCLACPSVPTREPKLKRLPGA
jgi:hypothetical protein